MLRTVLLKSLLYHENSLGMWCVNLKMVFKIIRHPRALPKGLNCEWKLWPFFPIPTSSLHIIVQRSMSTGGLWLKSTNHTIVRITVGDWIKVNSQLSLGSVCEYSTNFSSNHYKMQYVFFFLSSTDGYDKDPCSNYRTLRGADRAAGFNKLTKKSDKRKAWKEDWYRFTGDAGNKMATM